MQQKWRREQSSCPRPLWSFTRVGVLVGGGGGGEEWDAGNKQAGADDDHIHTDKDAGSCGHSCKLGVMDRDTTSTRGEEADWPVEAPMEEPPQVGDPPP